MSSPRPMAPSSGTPATSVAKRMQRVHWMQRVMIVLTSGPIYLSSTARLFSWIAAGVHAIGHGLVLQIAFAALVADRAIERMVDQQEFHHAFARLFHHRRLGEELLGRAVLVGSQILHAHGAGGLRLGDALHFDQAHAAIAGDRQPLMEAEARDFRARGFAGLEQRVLRRNVDLFAVDDELGHAFFFSSSDPTFSSHNSHFPVRVLAAPVVALRGRPSPGNAEHGPARQTPRPAARNAGIARGSSARGSVLRRRPPPSATRICS